MIWVVGYLIFVFFTNHIVAQIHRARMHELPVRVASVVLDLASGFAILLRVPIYLIGITLYNACCIGTMIAAFMDMIPVRVFTLWILVLADNLGYASFALRAFLVREFDCVRVYARSKWSFFYHEFHSGNGHVFSIRVNPNEYRSHELARECRVRREVQLQEVL